MRWKFSHLKKTRAPVRSSTVREVITGVRCAWPASRSAAEATSAKLTARAVLSGAFIRAGCDGSAPDFTPRPGLASAGPQPAPEQLSPRAGRLGQHAGIGVRALELRLEAHQLVAAKGVHPDALSRAAPGQDRVQSRLSGPQALHRDDQVAGGDARLL